MDRIGFYWKNSTTDAVGERNGVSLKELKALAPRVREITQKIQSERRTGAHRYRELPYNQDLVDSVNSEVEHFRDKCEILLVLGVNGGAMGNDALQSAINPRTYNLHTDRTRNGPQLFILDNADPDQIKSIVDFITPRLKRTIVNIVCGPDDGAEAAAQFILVRDLLLKKLGKRCKENILATLDPKGGGLKDFCLAEGYRSIESPEGIGNRHGILSAAGLFSASMTGVDIEALMAGAQDMDKRCKESDLFKNPAALIAAIHHVLCDKGKPISVLAPYSDSLQSLAQWQCRLWAESLVGKINLKKKEVPLGQPMVKTLGEDPCGPNDKIITFLEVERFNQKLPIPDTMKSVDSVKYLTGHTFQSIIQSRKLADEYAMLEGKRPTTTVLLPRISAETMGQFIYMYEVAVSYLGALMDLGPGEASAAPLVRNGAHALLGKPGSGDLAKAVSAVAQRDPKFKL